MIVILNIYLCCPVVVLAAVQPKAAIILKTP